MQWDQSYHMGRCLISLYEITIQVISSQMIITEMKNTKLMSGGVSVSCLGGGASKTLVGQSPNSVTTKVPYEVDVSVH